MQAMVFNESFFESRLYENKKACSRFSLVKTQSKFFLTKKLSVYAITIRTNGEDFYN